MFKISEHIYEAIKDSNFFLTELEILEREHLLNQIKLIYIDKEKKGNWIWEKLCEPAILHKEMPWKYIKNFVGSSECILFFNQDDEKKMFYITSGDELDFIISETYGFEFYVTNRNFEYMFCFNHHDTLFGCGTAKKWIDSINSK